MLVNVFLLDLFAMRSDSSALLVCSLIIYWFYYDLHFLFLDAINHFMSSLSRLKKVRANPFIFSTTFSRGFLLAAFKEPQTDGGWEGPLEGISPKLMLKTALNGKPG